MASSAISVFVLLSLAAAMTAFAQFSEDITHLHFYFHEIEPLSAQKPTVALLTSLHSSSSHFGNILVFDNYLREGSDPSSKLIGLAQGINVNTSLASSSILNAMNFVFTDGEYNGSSIAIFGGSDVTLPTDEKAIVGGTGKFRMARGYVTSKIVNFTPATIIVEADLYLVGGFY